MKCNVCHKTATATLKVTFAQDKVRPRVAVTFETEGGYCRDCEGRIARKAKAGLFNDIIGSDMRAQAETIFSLRGLGPIKWDETMVEFVDIKAPEDANQIKLPM